MVRDERKIVLVTGGTTRPVVRIFTAAGSAMGAFLWDKGRIAGLGWTSSLELVIMEVTGEVRVAYPSTLPEQWFWQGCFPPPAQLVADHILPRTQQHLIVGPKDLK